jgi:hypothetical protein
MFGAETLEGILGAIDPLLSDADKFKQRAGAEILSGVLRGVFFFFLNSSNLLIMLLKDPNTGPSH